LSPFTSLMPPVPNLCFCNILLTSGGYDALSRKAGHASAGRPEFIREGVPLIMSIAHELSCDVATAMLSERKDDRAASQGGDLASIVLEVHSTLRQLTSEARRTRRGPQASAPTTAGGHAASGGR
jgi:hypothetical protein